MHQIYVYKCLKTMLVKYKFWHCIKIKFYINTLKTMLVKYKFTYSSWYQQDQSPLKTMLVKYKWCLKSIELLKKEL